MAFFGEKDFQQLRVIERMVVDLDIPIEIVPCPIVREADGLAMSSRNAYLSKQERARAASLNKALRAAADSVAGGQGDASVLTQDIREGILSAGPADIEYIEVVDSQTLEPLERIERQARILLAVRYGDCRLIDNVGVVARK